MVLIALKGLVMLKDALAHSNRLCHDCMHSIKVFARSEGDNGDLLQKAGLVF